MRFRRLKSPTNVQWEITPNCNYRCFHCYNYWRNETGICGHIDYDIVVDQLIENHVFSVTLTGGEPLLVFTEIKPYIERMIQAGIKVAINTNASLLTQEMADFFKENHISLLISLPCCIPEINDQITTVKGSFDLTVSGIKLARRNQLNIAVNMVVSKLNKDYVIKTAKFLHDDLGLNVINVTKASRPINGQSAFDDYVLNLEELRKVFQDLLFVKKEFSMSVDSLGVYPECACDTVETYQLFTKRKCFAGKTTMSIGYNGNVKACARDITSYGNLNTQTLKACWDSMDDWRIVDASRLPAECKNCDMKGICTGGCRVELQNGIPHKSCIDSTNPVLGLKTISDSGYEYELEDRFKLADGVQFFEEDFGMRGISSNKKVFFVTNILYSFILQHNIFSKEKLMEKFDISSKIANDVLSYLVSNRAINLI